VPTHATVAVKVASNVPGDCLCSGGAARRARPLWPYPNGTAAVLARVTSATMEKQAGERLSVGDRAPDFTLPDQDGSPVSLADGIDKQVRQLIFFYPKADTPGCTTQACGLRDVAGDIGDTVVVGISPDKPEKQKRFDDKYGLGFQLLSDPDHAVADAYGVWGERKMYGKTYMGIIRSAFLVGGDGRIEHAWYKVSPKDTPANLLKALRP
jgi:thioredoxin-dependent peroxiredoxin